jgi:two-component system, NtrC family, sensor kinase
MRFKLYFLLVVLVTAVLVAASVNSYYELRSELNMRFEENKQALFKRLQMNLPITLWDFNDSQAAKIVDAELDSPDVAEIHVYHTGVGAKSGGAVHAKDLPQINEVNSKSSVENRERALPEDKMKIPLIMYLQNREQQQGVEVGYAEVIFSRQRVAQLLAVQIRSRIVEIVILDVLLGLLLFAVMSRMVITPLSQLSHAFKELAQNAGVNSELKIKGNDEFGEVVAAFNQIERRLVSDIDRRIEAEKNLRASNNDLAEAEKNLRTLNTDLTKALETIKMAQDTLVQTEKFASLGSLVAGVAHEINTPVGVTVTAASFLLEETQKLEKLVSEGAVKKSEFLQFIHTVAESAQLMLNSSERAVHLIRSFKQVAADETSEVRRSFDLNGYLGEVLTSLHPKYKKTHINVVISCPDGLEMDSYPGLLAQVMTNLVTNALIHGFDPGDEGEIAIRVRQEEPWVNIECANNGKIIPPQFISKIFEPFFTTRRSEGGTGLGLSIVFNIVTQRLGGTISVQSSESEGTKFTVRIPRVLVDKVSEGKQND